MNSFQNSIHFLLSAASLSQLPADNGSEVAFVGRSNAGKSSALNTITGIKKLAKVSNTPGRTQLINVFKVDDKKRLVDLPGYGYAAVPKAIKERWQATLAQYLETRHSLHGLILLMDARHPLKDLDVNFLMWGAARNLPVHILLTKSDKLSKTEAIKCLQQTKTALQSIYPAATVQLFSSTHKIGVKEAETQIKAWLEPPL